MTQLNAFPCALAWHTGCFYHKAQNHSLVAARYMLYGHDIRALHSDYVYIGNIQEILSKPI
jgi:hypothetical protein